MRIMFVSRFFPYIGGREATVKLLAEELSIEHDVALLTPDTGRPSLNFKTYKYPEKSGKIVKILDEFKPDVISSHTFYLTPDVLSVAIKKGIPVCLTLHGDLFNYGKQEDIDTFIDIANKANCVVSVCQHGLNSLNSNESLPKEKLSIIPNGIDTNKFMYRDCDRRELKNVFEIADDKFVFITPVRMTLYKGVDYLLDSIKEIKNKEDFHFLITTPPSRHRDDEIIYTEKVYERLDKEGLDKQVSIRFIDHSAMPVIYNLVDGFILPSETEQLPISIMEAQASQLPVIATNVGGVSEIVNDNKTGILVNYKDTAAMSDAISELYLNTQLRESISKNARDLILRKYSKTQMVNDYLKLFLEL